MSKHPTICQTCDLQITSNNSPISCKCWPPKMSSKTFTARHIRHSLRPQDIKSFSFLQSNSFIKAPKGQRQHQALRTCDVTWRGLSCVRVCSSEFQVPPSHGNPESLQGLQPMCAVIWVWSKGTSKDTCAGCCLDHPGEQYYIDNEGLSSQMRRTICSLTTNQYGSSWFYYPGKRPQTVCS